MKITKKEILNLKRGRKTKGLAGEWKNYFLADPGVEHYALLSYLSSKFEDATFIELGTLVGVGAVALAYNPTNHVITYDIQDKRSFNETSNIEFRLGDIFARGEESEMLDAELIHLDAAHDGKLEARVYDYLSNNDYKGLLVCDDIGLNDEMKTFWESITHTKWDLTEVGHGNMSRFGTIPGTGLVDFSGEVVVSL